ncbi:hypothetical protein V2J09_004342 [Rumex salicifolius]
MASGSVETNDSEKIVGVAMSFPATDSFSPSSKVSRRLRRRLLVESKAPSTAEEIDAKLKEADLRRQQFYEALSSKARQKQRILWSYSQESELGQRLQAKLIAAEQKRLIRLSKLDELRRAARNEAGMRLKKERDELRMKVESQIQQAEMKRLQIQKTNRQLRVARNERVTQTLMRRVMQEKRYKECVTAAIQQKRLAAERKRLGFLEAERSKARARLLRVQRVANLVSTQRETERMRKKDVLEQRLQRAKSQRSKFLKKKMKSAQCSPTGNSNLTINQAEVLPIKLARYWRCFVKLKGTTYELTKAFISFSLNEKSVKQLPFEQLALKLGSDMTLKAVRSLLERLETRLLIQYAVGNGINSRTQVENIDLLLKRVASESRKGRSNHRSRIKAVKKGGSSKEHTQSKKVSRYQVRILLCAYMILGHPDAVLSRKGELETALADSAAKLIREFELLVKVILGGSDAENKCEITSTGSTVSFRRQLEEFDQAWCTYLFQFVVWKTKDAESLEQDLIKAASQLELSMMRTCKMTSEGGQGGLTHGMKFIQKQVIEDQRLLKAKVKNLTGETGVERMEFALSDTRSKYFASKETRSPLQSPVSYLTSPSSSGSEDGSLVSVSSKISNLAGDEGLGGVARSLFKEDDPSSRKEVFSSSSSVGSLIIGSIPLSQNEVLVNEIVHEHHYALPYNFDVIDRDESGIKVKETMEKAFWDAIMDSVQREEPDFSWFLKLMTEVRDELCEISPGNWKQEIIDTIDLDILSQVVGSGTLDMSYLGRILEFALNTLQKLSAPAKEDELKATHQHLVRELLEVSQSQSLFAIALIKGLRFVLQELQALKREISRARIKLIEPFIRGPAGLEYMQKAFSNRYGTPSNACKSLPLTMRWLSSVNPDNEQEWVEHTESFSTFPTCLASHPPGLPSFALRTGGSVSAALNVPSAVTNIMGTELPECTGKRIDLLVRLGLLKLVSAIEGLTPDDLPETLNLNLSRLRSVQHQLQKVIVISTSMLILRQTLVTEKPASTLEMEKMISECTERLSELLNTVEDVGITEIVDAIFSKPSEDCNSVVVPDPKKLESVKGMAANVLAKSLQSGDAIFTQVSRVIYLGMRGLVLGGTGSKGREVAKRALQRIGAASLAGKVAEAAQVLITVATISEIVHRAWYEELVQKM